MGIYDLKNKEKRKEQVKEYQKITQYNINNQQKVKNQIQYLNGNNLVLLPIIWMNYMKDI